MDARLAVIFRKEYTLGAPTLIDLLPERKRRTEESAIDFILERTFMRPRDIIDFLNTCIDQNDSISSLSWSNLTRAEYEYSGRRVQSVFDEWKDSYFGLPLTDSLIRTLGPKFGSNEFTDDLLFSILGDLRCEKCNWMSDLRDKTIGGALSYQQTKIEILKALYLVGILGIKVPGHTQTLYSFEQSFGFAPEPLESCSFGVHKMFWSAFNLISDRKSDIHDQ